MSAGVVELYPGHEEHPDPGTQLPELAAEVVAAGDPVSGALEVEATGVEPATSGVPGSR